jgi:ketosteroid isomerase-like protein
MTGSTPSPRDVFERGQRMLLDFDLDGFADLFAVDGVLELPFAAPAARRRYEGREEVRHDMRERGGRAREADVRIVRFRSLVVHETTDPEVIVAEFVQDVAFGEHTREMAFVQVVRVRDGEIVAFRDYMDTLALVDATSALPELRDALVGTPPHEIENRSPAR